MADELIKPFSWALVVREATGEKVIKYKGEYMTEAKRDVLEYHDLHHKFQLMSLPPELRGHALSYLPEVFGSHRIPVYLPGYFGAPTKIQLPPITQAGDKLLRQEAIKVTIEKSTFAIRSGPGNERFQRWLRDQDLSLTANNYHNGFDAVKRLEFPYFSRYPHHSLPTTKLNNDIELMRSCGNLESVGVEWVGMEVVQATSGLPKTVQTLRAQYRLDRMLTCGNLKKLRLVKRNCGGASETALRDLADWFRTALPSTPTRPMVEVTVGLRW